MNENNEMAQAIKYLSEAISSNIFVKMSDAELFQAYKKAAISLSIAAEKLTLKIIEELSDYHASEQSIDALDKAGVQTQMDLHNLQLQEGSYNWVLVHQQALLHCLRSE